MTYSRNTDPVRRCKRQLVKAFDKAKVIQGIELDLRIVEIESNLEKALSAINSLSSINAQLQSQIQNLLPASKVNYIPPGWDASVWNKLPPQDKRHFRFLHRRRGFRPDYRTEMPLEQLTEQFKQKQKDELKTAVVEVSPQEKQRLEALRLEALKLLREEENND